MASPEWKILDLAPPLMLRRRLSDQFQILHQLTDRDPELVGVYDPREIHMFLLPPRPFAKEILILRDEDAANFRRPLQ
jgi:hypothetical protein